MKKLMYFALLAIAMTGCKQEQANKVELALAHQRDSLNQIIAQKDNEINDMMTTFSDIEEGFREINEAQDRVAIAQQGEGSSSKARIKENIQFIKSAMKQNKELINKLKQQLRESSFNSDALKRMIESLQAQMEEKEQQIVQLREELDARDIHIAELDEQVANQNTAIDDLVEESAQKTQVINKQDKDLHTAWFVYGTEKELKEQSVIDKKGNVLKANFNKDYFTKIDYRVDKEVKFYSKSARILTPHPAEAYKLEQDANKQFILRITNPDLFWSTSKYLVVQVK